MRLGGEVAVVLADVRGVDAGGVLRLHRFLGGKIANESARQREERDEQRRRRSAFYFFHMATDSIRRRAIPVASPASSRLE